MRADDDILQTILGGVEEGRYRADAVMGFIFEGIDQAVREAEKAARGSSKPIAIDGSASCKPFPSGLLASLPLQSGANRAW